jgi:hypothetical protein
MLAITYKKITKIKVAKWGTPKKILKKNISKSDPIFIHCKSIFRTQKMLMKIERNMINIMDNENKEIVERFPLR